MRFWNSPKPTIAAVHGYCLGSAMEMAVACDITVASRNCRFGAPEVKFGSGIVALLLPWLIGPKMAKELLLTGDDKVTAERAEAMGLINRVVEGELLEQAAGEYANQLAANDLTAVRLTKQAINRSYQIMGMPQALAEALELDVEIESTPSEQPGESK
jgi:enoyl-CoA hydratase